MEVSRSALGQARDLGILAERAARLALRLGGVAVALAIALMAAPALAADGPQGLTTPMVLPPFDPTAPACSVPPGLSPSLAFVQDNRRKFIEGAGYGIGLAAKDRGLDYRDLVANDDAAQQAAQVASQVSGKVGAVIVPPVDSAAIAPTLKQAIWSGAYVATIVPPPATTILNAPQYKTGLVLGEAAASYIREHFHGKADVVLLTQDSLQFLAPRFAAMRDALKDMTEVNMVADISPDPVSEDGGYQMMKLILEAHPNVDVVLGADTVVVGALKALREAGKARPDQFLGGIDGEPDAIAEIRAGNGPYKLTVALASPVFGYALGMAAADWLEGKSVPQAMDALPIALSAANMAQYEADMAAPGAVYADAARRDTYIKRYGNICFDSRDQYLDFPWSSEAH
jgi:ribose transport system substrate-binding protein